MNPFKRLYGVYLDWRATRLERGIPYFSDEHGQKHPVSEPRDELDNALRTHYGLTSEQLGIGASTEPPGDLETNVNEVEE